MPSMHEFWISGDRGTQGYRNLRDGDGGSASEIRTWLESNWQAFSPYADERFREEFSLQPHARFWEIFLCIQLLESGKNLIEREDRPSDGPDFLIVDGNNKVWIEAVTFNHGSDSNADRVPGLRFDGEAHDVPVNEVELRISSAFSAKAVKYDEYTRSGLVSHDDTRIVAINPGEVGIQCSDEDSASPFVVLYPLGNRYISFFQNSDRTESGYHSRTEIVRNSGAEVPTGYFAREEYAHISGVVWSRTTLGNIHLGGHGLAFYPNCAATVRLEQGWMDWSVEWACTATDEGVCTITRAA